MKRKQKQLPAICLRQVISLLQKQRQLRSKTNG